MSIATDLTTRAEVGPLDWHEDRVRAVMNADASSVGDSMAFLVPVAGGPGWHSTSDGGPVVFVSSGIGVFRASRGDTHELPLGHLESRSVDTERAWDDVVELGSDAVSDLLVVGDVHGDAKNLADAVDVGVGLGVGAVVQVGDFWLADVQWSRLNPLESQFMWTAHDSPLPIVVIDGNHEAWPALGRYASTAAARAARLSRRPLHLGGSIWWAWRGSVWSRGGRAFGALGSAVSPDRHSPAVRGYRRDEEAATEEDLKRLTANVDAEFGDGLDVLFTHDAPSQVRGLKAGMSGVPWDIQQAAKQGRGLLGHAVERTQPAYVLHGHWHQTNREHICESTEVFGLSADGMANSTAHLTVQPALAATNMS